MSGFFSDSHLHSDIPMSEGHPPMFEGTIPSVSFSTLTTFEQCNYAVYLSKVVKTGNVGSPATDRGSALHEMLEDYVNGDREDVEWSDMRSGDYHQDFIEAFKTATEEGRGIPELKLAFTKDLELTDWDSDDMWLRGAIDQVVFTFDGLHADIFDYKSGSNKSTAKHRSQLMLYACMMFLAYPKLETIKTAPIYLDHRQELFINDYHRNDLDMFWPRFKERLQVVTDTHVFSPNPSGWNCKWCQHKVAQEELGQTEPACIYSN